MPISEAVAAYIRPDQSEKFYDDQLRSILSEQLLVLDLVQNLGDPLTSTSDNVRSRATLLLAQVCAAKTQQLGPAAEAELATFFAARLSDWPCQTSALQGCLALAQRAQGGTIPPGFERSIAVAVASQYLDGVNVQHLRQPDRETSYKLLKCLLQLHGPTMLEDGVPALDIIIATVDGERDPRCLLLAFNCIQLIVKLHLQIGSSFIRLLVEKAEELSDVLSCYFPIAFSPPPDDPHGITREDLQAALQATLACAPQFAPHIVPLLLEKLASSLRQAKLDALSTLGQCAIGWGGVALVEHCALQQVWEGLRAELLAQAAELEDDLGSLPAAARTCLLACLQAVDAADNHELVDLVLSDTRVADLFVVLMESATGDAERLAPAVHSRAAVLATVAESSLYGSQQACSNILPRLFNCLKHESASQLTPLSDLALSVVVELLQAARKQQLCSTSCGASDPHLLHPWADQLLAAAMQPPLCLVQPSVNADAQNEVADLTFQQQLPDEGSALQPSVQQSVKLWQIQLLGSLAAFPPDHTPLTAGQQEAVLTVLLAQLSNDGSGAGVACAQAASVALQQMAGSGRSGLLVQLAVPWLVKGLDSDATHGPRSSLDALAALATSSPALRPAVLTALVPSCLRASPHTALANHTRVAVLASLADPILPACRQDGSHSLSEATQTLALSLLQAVRQDYALPVTSTARAVAAATTVCSAEHQTAVAEAAAQIISMHSNMASPSPANLAALAALSSLRRGVAAHVLTLGLLQGIVDLALAAEQDEVAGAACIAAASIINKWPAGGSSGVALQEAAGAAVGAASRPCRLALQGSCPAAASIRGLQCLSLLGRGLSMRRQGLDCTPVMLDILDAAPAAEVSGAGGQAAAQGAASAAKGRGSAAAAARQAPDPSVVAAAARSFAQTIGSSSPSRICELSRATHAQEVVLWQQRAFASALQKLMTRLGSDWHSQLPRKAPLVLALALLLAQVPAALYRTELPDLLPLIASGLQHLPETSLADGEGALSLLQVLSAGFEDARVRRQLEGLADVLMPSLAKLASTHRMPSVRLAAFSALQAALVLPYAVLHPHRTIILKAVTAGLDDSRRAVRLAAVQCRHAWSSS